MNVYLVWGRVPGSYDDTTHIIAAESFREAEEVFTQLEHDTYTQDDLDAVEREHGVTIFVDGIEQIGELVEVNGEKLIRPDPAMICGI